MAKQQNYRKVLTANRLGDGLVVFHARDGGWSEWIEDALPVNGADDIAALEQLGIVAETSNIVVGPYLIDVEDETGDLVPVRYREKLRTQGPSVRGDLGKQAESAAGALRLAG